MSFHRVVFVAVATLLSIGMTSIASAGCCDGGYSAPVYATVAPVGYGGYGGYGGCGACGTPTAAAVFAVPVAPAVPAPIVVSAAVPSGFGGPCCSWNGCGNCGWSGWSSGCGNCGASVGWGGCGNCGGCGAELATLPSASAVVCESCGRKLDVGGGQIPCRNCGAPLSFPVGASRIDCPYCQSGTHRL